MSGPSGTALPLLRRGGVVIASATAVSPFSPRKAACRFASWLAKLWRLNNMKDCWNIANSHIQGPARPAGVLEESSAVAGAAESSYDHCRISCQVISNVAPYRLYRGITQQVDSAGCSICVLSQSTGHCQLATASQVVGHSAAPCQGIGVQCLQTGKFKLQFSARPLSPHRLCTALTAPGCPAAAGAS